MEALLIARGPTLSQSVLEGAFQVQLSDIHFYHWLNAIGGFTACIG